MASDLDKIGPGFKIATFDIESTALEADHGYMLTACVKEVNKNDLKGITHTFRIDDRRNPDKFSDKWVVQKLVECLDSYDLVIGWYSSRFDIPFINTRALKHGVKPPARKYRRDLCLCARGFGKLKNNRLATWDKFLHGKTDKTWLNWDTWLMAMRGDKKALDYIVEHNQKDCYVTERVYKRVLPLLGKLRKN